jgi:hypothetical protein
VIGDLDRLQMVEVEQDGKRFLLRSEMQGTRPFTVTGSGYKIASDNALANPRGGGGHDPGTRVRAVS